MKEYEELIDIVSGRIPYERLLKIARKMHLWIFLHTDDEQKVYDELGLTEEENDLLGYVGQFIIEGEEDE